MFGMKIIMVRLLMGVRGNLAEIIRSGCYAEVRGCSILITAVVLAATTIIRVTDSTSSDFGLSVRRRRFLNLLLSSPLA